MLSLSLATYKPIKKIKPLSFKGISDCRLTMDLGTTYQLLITIDTANPEYDELRGKSDACIWLSTDNLDLLFVKAREPQKDKVGGLCELTFYECSYMLKFTEPANLFKPYFGSLIQYLSGLSKEFIFTLLAADQKIIIDSGTLDNLSLMSTATGKAVGLTYRSAGLVQTSNGYLPVIEISDFRHLETVSQSDWRYRAFFAKNSFSNIKNDILKLNNLTLSYPGAIPKYLLVLGASGDGSTSSSVIKFDNDSYPWLDPNYPLVRINSNYYIYNSKVSKTNTEFDIKIVKLNQNLEIQDSEFLVQNNPINSPIAQSLITNKPKRIIDRDKGLQALYNEGLAYLQKRQDLVTYEFDVDYPDIILPGNKIVVKYLEQQVATTGQKRTTFNIDAAFIARNLQFDLRKFV